MNIGLVLSGGGAKGAYQAGVIKSMANNGIDISVISGASIGALNGAIISASENTNVAAKRLEEIWKLVAEDDVLKINTDVYPRYLAMLATAGLTGIGSLGLKLLARWAGEEKDEGFFDISPLTKILDRYLDLKSIANGTPLYVSLYPYRGRLHGVSEFLKGDVIGRFDTQESVFKLVQSLSHSEQKEAVLASAAIPVLFSPRKIGGKFFSDGGQGNYRSAQGNTPITPLIGQGLDAIIVSHLDDGSLWNVDDFPEENIFEIRPSERIAKNGAKDMLGFDSASILHWMSQGEADTDILLRKLKRFSSARTSMQDSSENLKNKIESMGGSLKSKDLEALMVKLGKK